MCLVPRCPEYAAVRGRCVTHHRANDALLKAQPASDRAVYKTAKWRGLRRRVLKEQPWCAVLECVNLATDVDHIVPIAQGGARWDRDNLQGLCHRCHSRKTARETWNR